MDDKNCHNKQFVAISGVTISGKHSIQILLWHLIGLFAKISGEKKYFLLSPNMNSKWDSVHSLFCFLSFFRLGQSNKRRQFVTA